MGQTTFRKKARMVIVTVSTLWMAATVYTEFFIVLPGTYGYDTPEMQDRLSACTGTFLERYRCKDLVIIQKGRDDFLIWLEKVALVFGPPAVLFGLLRIGRPKLPGGDDYADTDLPPPPTDIARWRVR